MQELFTSFAARWVFNIQQPLSFIFPHPLISGSHTAVMEMEIEFFRGNFPEQNPKPLTDHIQKMESGEAPFFPATLSLVYGKLLSKALPQPVAYGSSHRMLPGSGDEGATRAGFSQPLRPLLKCGKCGENERLQNLRHEGYCPRCFRRLGLLQYVFCFLPSRFTPLMECPSCNSLRRTTHVYCQEQRCGIHFG